MAFNDSRKQLAKDSRDRLGEPAVYTNKANVSTATIVIVHRARSMSDTRKVQSEAKRLSQSVTTITTFAVGDEFDLDLQALRQGDKVVLDGSGETFALDGASIQRDEFKVVTPAVPVLA